MAAPVERVDELAKAYRDAWEYVQDWQLSLVNNPLREAQRKRLRETAAEIHRRMEELPVLAGEWLAVQLPLIYADGAERDIVYTRIHRDAVQALVDQVHGDLLKATTHVDRFTKRLVRKVANDQALRATIVGQTPQQAAREMRRILATHGVHAVTYANGRRTGLAEYAEMSLRTVTAVAYNTGALNGSPEVAMWEVFDGAGCGWTTHHDPREANGLILPRDEAFEHLVSHPNCVTPGTRVLPVGDLEAVYRVPWVGPLVEVTTRDGRRVTVGPNHPVLTGRGWLRANDLQPGDQAVGRSVHGPITGAAGLQDFVDMPRVEQVFETHAVSGRLVRTPAAPGQFHGDGEFGYGEVDIVSVVRELSQRGQPTVQQQAAEDAFVFADPQAAFVPGLGSLGVVVPSGEHSPDPRLGRPGVSGPGPDSDSPGFQFSDQPLSAYSERPLQGLQSAAGLVLFDGVHQSGFRHPVGTAAERNSSIPNRLTDELLKLAAAGHLVDWDSGAVQFDEVVKVRRFQWSGHVYDLQTSSGTYWADGILTHNCRRAFGPRPDLAAPGKLRV